jgi:cation diffusion facilitator CzcD-associated flavoprotein CzcO
VTLFEKSYRPGGLWPLTETDEGLINPDMTTNISRFLVAFGDKAWPADAPLFPKAYQVGQYLHRYIDTYLAKAVDIRYSCPVKAISEPKPGSEDTQWRVRVSNRQGEVAVEEEHRFDHVIISSGFFGKAKIASYIHQGLDQNVPVVHSTAFRHIKDLLKNVKKPGKIVVVGGSISGAETAARVADQLSTEMYSPQQSSIQNVDQFSVHHIGRQPFWTFPRLLSPDVTITGKDESEKVNKLIPMPRGI